MFADAVPTLKPGETSGILKSPNGFHIVKLLESRSTGGKQVVDQTRARHILIKVNEIVSEADAKARIDRIKDRLDRGAKFEELAKLNSEDLSRREGRRSRLGQPRRDRPRIRAAMNKLALDGVSEPVRTPFGWHLIQVLERRKEDVTLGEVARGRAHGDPRAQERRGVPGLAAPAARPRVRRVPARRALIAAARGRLRLSRAHAAEP